MDFEDLVTALAPPTNRIAKSDGEHEHHLYEGAVMVAYAMHLLRTQDTRHVRVHPDAEHRKQFDFASWLLRRGFLKISNVGSTSYGGTYRDAAGEEITVNPKSGWGTWSQRSATTSFPPSARAGSSTRGIRARCLDFTRVCARRSAC